MNRKSLVTAARSLGYKGGAADSDKDTLKKWWNSEGFEDAIAVGEGTKTFDEVWGTKATFTLDPDESLNEIKVVMGEQQAADDEDEQPPAEDGKSYEPQYRAGSLRAKQREALGDHNRISADIEKASRGVKGFRMTPEAQRRTMDRKAYDRARESGTPIRVVGQKASVPAFESSEAAEYFAANSRLTAMGWKDYPLKSWDQEIVGKSQVSYDNNLGGNWIVPEISNTLIELKNQHGGVRRACGVTPMTSQIKWMPRFGDDVQGGDVAEGGSIPTSEVGTNRVQLTAQKSGCIVKVSNETLRDSSVSMADAIARSAARWAGRFEDALCFNGTITIGSNTYTRQGIIGLLGTNSEYDATLATPLWSEHSITGVTGVQSKLAPFAYEYGQVAWFGSLAAYHQILKRFQAVAGGTTGQMLKSGFGPDLMYDGSPFYVINSLPQSVAANQYSLFFGSLDACCKFGEVNGSQRFDTTDQRYFDEDNWAMRYLYEWAWNPHDVNNTLDASNISESGIIALKD